MSMSERAQLPAGAETARAARSLGRYRLLALLGKSDRTMIWRASDPRREGDLALVLPRVQPSDAAALQRWHLAVRRATRLSHPNLAPALEIGEHERWPFVVHSLAGSDTLEERLADASWSPADIARTFGRMLEGLAFAHQAGVAHGDLQTTMLLMGRAGDVTLMGLEVAAESEPGAGGGRGGSGIEEGVLRAHREAALRDVLAAGVLLHHALVRRPALDEPDSGRVIERLPPAGRETVRLPWDTVRTIPEGLRAIANRATDRQPRLRYHSVRALAQALDGWLQSDASNDRAGPIAVLFDRLHRVGMLPARPGASARAARLALLERGRDDELAQIVLQDPALALETLRAVNTAAMHASLARGSGPVLTVRRAIAMVGLDGVRRAALSLRPWPGPLDAAAAELLDDVLERVMRAGRLAQRLRPAGYDAELVYLVAMLQNLGPMLLQYHFSDEAQQIRRLVQPGRAITSEGGDEPGMTEAAASLAVLGVESGTIGSAVVRHIGFDDAVLHMVHRYSPSVPIRMPDSDLDRIRAAASCANETLEAAQQPAARVPAALARVARRYARALDLDLPALQLALKQSAERTPPGDGPLLSHGASH